MIRSLQRPVTVGVHAITRFLRPLGAPPAMPGHSASQTSAVALDRIARTARR